MIYIYGCKTHKDHPRVEVSHGMMEMPKHWCSECGGEMAKVPQRFRWYNSPWDVYYQKAEQKYIDYRERMKKNHANQRRIKERS